MTTISSNINAGADLDSTNLRPEGQDVGDDGVYGTDAVDRTSGTKASMQTNATQNVNASINVASEEARNRCGGSAAATSRNGRQDSQDDILHIPSDDGIARRPTETSAWDWDTPLESIGESSSYYYEPQGELLHEAREQHSFSKEFSIPQAVASPHVHWSQSTSSSGPKGQFVTPVSTLGRQSSIAGNKRKSTSDREDTSKQPDSKRASRLMSESGEDLMSPEEDRPPVHATRSQSGASTRPRTATQSSENRSRPALTNVEAVSLQGATSGPRRTLEDPSIPMVLPARKVFPIQIGDKLFRLSGASISSDGEFIDDISPIPMVLTDS